MKYPTSRDDQQAVRHDLRLPHQTFVVPVHDDQKLCFPPFATSTCLGDVFSPTASFAPCVPARPSLLDAYSQNPTPLLSCLRHTVLRPRTTIASRHRVPSDQRTSLILVERKFPRSDAHDSSQPCSHHPAITHFSRNIASSPVRAPLQRSMHTAIIHAPTRQKKFYSTL